MAIERFFPKASMKMSRTMTMPRTNSIAGRGTFGAGLTSSGTWGGEEPSSKEVPYISFQAIVGRNSRFHDLTEEQMDELGGVEYRGLRILLIIVSAVSPYTLSATSSSLLSTGHGASDEADPMPLSTLSVSSLPGSSLSHPTSRKEAGTTTTCSTRNTNTYRPLGSRSSMSFRHSPTRAPVSRMPV